MKVLRFLLATVVLSAAAIYAQRAWASLVPWPMVLHGPLVDAQLIRAHFPLHLVSPDWIHATGQELASRWRSAETYLRSVVVFALWLACELLAFRWARRVGSANQAVQATAAKPSS